MKIHWPRRPLGLGPQLNLVTLSREHRVGLGRRALQSVAIAIAAAIVIAAIDQFFFEGATARRTPALNVHPTPAARVAVCFIGGFLEEIVFRVLLASAVAAVAWSALRRFGGRMSNVAAAQWTGTVAAAIVVGIWHVGMVADPASNDMRVLAVNGVSNLVYGWTYWRRGLELSTLTHGALNSSLYLGLPLLH